MTVPWPNQAADAWNRCELGGIELPGLARVDIELSEKLDVKSPLGANGATITRQGYLPARVVLTLRLWEPEQFTTFQLVAVPLRPRVGSGQTPTALSIVHPKTALWGITAVSIEKILDRNGERGDVYDVVFECIEHFPPPKATVTKTDKKSLGPFSNSIAAASPPMPSETNRGP